MDEKELDPRREELVREFFASQPELLSSPRGITAGELNARLADFLVADFLDRKQERDMNALAKARFDPTINLGHVLTLLTVVISFGGLLWHFSGTQAGMMKDLDASNARAIRYIPMLEAANKVNDIQETRLGNLADTVIEIRRQNAETSTLLGTIREDLATIKTQLRINSDQRR